MVVVDSLEMSVTIIIHELHLSQQPLKQYFICGQIIAQSEECNARLGEVDLEGFASRVKSLKKCKCSSNVIQAI